MTEIGDPGGNRRLPGELSVFLRALGTPPDSAEMRELVALTGVEPVATGLDHGDGGYYMESPDASLDVLVEDGVVETFFLGVRGDSNGVYARLDQLVPGLTADSTPEDLRRIFGSPLRSGKQYEFFDLGAGFVHAKFGAEGLEMIRVAAHDVLA